MLAWCSLLGICSVWLASGLLSNSPGMDGLHRSWGHEPGWKWGQEGTECSESHCVISLVLPRIPLSSGSESCTRNYREAATVIQNVMSWIMFCFRPSRPRTFPESAKIRAFQLFGWRPSWWIPQRWTFWWPSRQQFIFSRGPEWQ